MQNLTDIDIPEDNIICDLFMQQVVLACVTSADEAGIFTSLADDAKSIGSLADCIDSSPESVSAVTRVLAANGFLIENNGQFKLTPAAKTYLVKDSSFYRGFQFKSSQNFWHDKILNTLRAGWSPIGADGNSFSSMWENGSLSQEAADRFTGMMHTNISGPAIAAARSGVFDKFGHIVDVGGGSGIFLAALKQQHPTKDLTLLELPPVCKSAEKILKGYIDPTKINFSPCNLFTDDWPNNGDAFFLSNVLHDWPISKAKVILKKAFDYLKDGGSIFVYECLLDESRLSPKHTVAFDLLMHANHQSQQYSLRDLSELLVESGFSSPKKVFSFGYYSLVEANKRI